MVMRQNVGDSIFNVLLWHWHELDGAETAANTNTSASTSYGHALYTQKHTFATADHTIFQYSSLFPPRCTSERWSSFVIEYSLMEINLLEVLVRFPVKVLPHSTPITWTHANNERNREGTTALGRGIHWPRNIIIYILQIFAKWTLVVNSGGHLNIFASIYAGW